MPESSSPNSAVRKIADGVFRADVCYPAPESTAAYLIADGGRGALIDCGAKAGVPAVAAMIEAAGLAPEDVDFIIPTHAHLDHCAAAGTLAQMLPRATVAVHPAAAPHLKDPDAKLVPAARALYGDDFFAKHYGEILPVPAERIREMADGESLKTGARILRTPHTPGHAWHHLSVWDETGGVIFSGDAMGVSYRNFDAESGGPMAVPSTPPNQFNPEATRASIEKMRDLKPDLAALAHFGEIRFTPDIAALALEIMERWMADAKTLDLSDGDDAALTARLTNQMRTALAETTGADIGRVAERFRLDLLLCSAGMLHWLRKNAK